VTKSVFIKSTFTEEILVIQTLYQQSGPSKYDSGDDDNDDDDDDDDDDVRNTVHPDRANGELRGI